MTGAITVRSAAVDDAAAIARIHSQGIRERIATFETEEPTEADRRAWLAGRDRRYPVVVAERDGQVVGWASASPYRPRACYAGVAEFSIYVDTDARGQGVGTALLEGLIAASEEAGLWKLLSRVFVENTASRALCRRCGFREVGIYEKHAKLDGVWRDTVIVERLIPTNQD
jgi:phosphinothricin acetyltransferase